MVFRIENEGYYSTRGRRDGTSKQTVFVRPNTEGWYDKLPWIVSRGPDFCRYDYTVDDEGLVWPISLEDRYRDNPEPRLIPCPVHDAWDIVSEVILFQKPCPCNAPFFQSGCLGHRDDCPY